MQITKNQTTVLTADISTHHSFNQYILHYTSSAPLQGVITYEEQKDHHLVNRSETFFLEAGENMTFSSYIDGYLTGHIAKDFHALTLATIPTAKETDPVAEFSLQNFVTQTCPVLSETTYFFENERYRVGVELCWGGGLSYLADKKCPVEGLENILNNYDTGRLIQQSYYGTSQPPYVMGEFMGNKWCYNPVQGGDRGNHKSKLIDAKVSHDCVYVKCRPRDWGHDGGVTYAYMENWYRLDGDYLVVDNRFVDFSGYTHPVAGQEVPAFYTVSYLNNYYWYDGEKPWSNDALSVKSDLPFWPDDWPYCTFVPKAGNTELWSAFVDDNGYGLGLFTPAVHHTVAGRHMYDGSKDPHAASCNYIAPLAIKQIVCFEPITYSYLITAGQLDVIRQNFFARKDHILNEGLTLTHV